VDWLPRHHHWNIALALDSDAIQTSVAWVTAAFAAVLRISRVSDNDKPTVACIGEDWSQRELLLSQKWGTVGGWWSTIHSEMFWKLIQNSNLKWSLRPFNKSSQSLRARWCGELWGMATTIGETWSGSVTWIFIIPSRNPESPVETKSTLAREYRPWISDFVSW
jgi:hypothetical protein